MHPQGGHVDSFTDPTTGEPLDFGVKSFIDTGNASAFFERMGVPTGTGPTVTTDTTYIDFLTGKVLNFTPPAFPDQLAVLSTFLDIVEPWEHLMQPGYFEFPKGKDIPADLLIPFGDFVTKYGLEDGVNFMYLTTGLGCGNLTNEVTMFVLQSFGASMARSILGLQGSFVPASGRNQDLYDAIGKNLGDDVLYSSTVISSLRTDFGVFLTVRNSKTGKITLVTARRLLMAIEPTPQNMPPFDLSSDETEILGRFTYTREYTGIVDNPSFAINQTYFNLPSNAAPDNYLVYPEASMVARYDYLGLGNYFRVTIVGDDTLDTCGAKRITQRDFKTLRKAGVLDARGEFPDDNTIHWNDFSAHGAMHARVTADEVYDGFYEDLYKLQGKRSTWWTGGAWSVNFQTTLWEYDDIIIPRLLHGLD